MTKTFRIINLFGGCYSSYTPPSGILPFHTVIPFQKLWWWWRYICLSSMHPTTLEILKEIRIIGLLPDVTERCYQVNVIYQISLLIIIIPCGGPLTYSPVILPFDGFVSRKKISEWVWEGCTLSLKSASRLIMCSASPKCCFLIWLIIFQWGKKLQILLFPFASRLFFIPYGRQFCLFYVKCT